MILYKIALIIHIVSGIMALLTGMSAIIATKGKGMHAMSGIAFFYSMLLVCLSAMFISILKNNQFLLHIGLLSFYYVYNGYRSVRNKSLKPTAPDWVMLIITLVNTMLMIASINIVLMVFGIIGFLLAMSDFRIFVLTTRHKELPKKQWLLRHLGMMLGAYISTVTAFIVVNITIISYPWIPWLAPSIMGVPLIIYWRKKYSVKGYQNAK